MIEFVYEYVVKEEARGFFELAFGPGGAWSRLFDKSEGYRGTALLRDVNERRRFLVSDAWDTVEQREGALAERQATYDRLEAEFATWCETTRALGSFRLVAEATVRPRRRGRRRDRR